MKNDSSFYKKIVKKRRKREEIAMKKACKVLKLVVL